jgi:endo-1,4-beta-xylanase
MGGFGALHLGFKYPDQFIAVTGNSPANVQAVTDGMGTQAYWDSQSLKASATANAAKLKSQSIRVIIGDQDGLLPVAKLVDTLLTDLKVAHEFTPVVGSPHNHDQLVQYETFDTMAFYGKVFAQYKTGR